MRENGNRTEIQFEIISQKQAEAITPREMFSRFSAFNTAVIEKLKELKPNQALTFPAPLKGEDLDRKETTAMMASLSRRIKYLKLSHRVRSSAANKVIVVMRGAKS